MTKEQLKEVRVSLGLTQLQFAQILGLKRKSTICNYEKGIRKVPGWVGKMCGLPKVIIDGRYYFEIPMDLTIIRDNGNI